MFRKILVANRGEIAVRAFRAATELGVATVAVFPYEDRFAEYRLKADESYQIGEVGLPVRAYLDVDGIIHAALEAEAPAVCVVDSVQTMHSDDLSSAAGSVA